MPRFLARVLVASCWVVLLLWTAMANGQDTLAKRFFHCELIGVETGLSQGLVKAIVQDSSGFLWFGTGDGINRYDGYSMRVYRHHADDSNSLSESFCQDMILDSRGWLWVATRIGLHIYDDRLDRFVKVSDQDSLLVLDNWDHNLIEDGSGNVWMISADGQPMLVPVPDGVKAGSSPTAIAGQLGLRFARDHYPGFPTSLNSPDRNRRFAFNRTGHFWYLIHNELHRLELDEEQQTARSLPVRTLPPTFEMAGRPRNKGWMDLVVDPQRSRCVYRGAHAFYQLDADSGTVIDSFPIPAGAPKSFLMYMGDNGEVFAETYKKGLIHLDLNTGVVDQVQIFNNNRLFSRVFNYVLWDRSGNLWMGTNGFGVMKYTTTRQRFGRYPSDGSSWYIARMTEDIDGRLLVNNHLDKRFNLASGRMEPAEAPDFRPWANPPPASRNYVQDSTGCYWFPADPVIHSAEEAHTVFYRFHPEEGEMQAWVGGDSSAFSFQYTWLDRQGNLWVSGEPIRGESGILRISQTHRDSIEQWIPIPTSKTTGVWRARHVAETEPGHFWITSNSEITEVRLNPLEINHLTIPDLRNQGPSTFRPFQVLIDPLDHDLLWIAGNYGLRQYNRKTKDWKLYTTEDGLPNNVVYSLAADYRNNLWLSTNSGLCLFDRDQGPVRSFGEADGLQNDEFNRKAALCTEAGILVFGGVKGLSYFDPAGFYADTLESAVVLTGLRLFNRPVPVVTDPKSDDPEAWGLPQRIDQLSELVVRHDQSILTFSFAVLDYSTPERNRFRYRMDGFNEQWIDAGDLHEATFTNLDPGCYTFRVQGCNSAGVWGQQEATLDLVVLPPWWQTWWFRTAVILAILAIGYAGFRYRLRQLLRLQRMRDRIARDLHDEIGSTLSSISLYSAAAEGTLENPSEQTQLMLGRIGENATEVMESMNDIVWAINTDNDDVDHMVNRMRTFAVELLEPTDCTLHFEASDQLSGQKLEMVYRRNLYLIFKEAVNNAAKYADCRNLWVRVGAAKGQLSLVIRDDGKGFDPSATEKADSLGGNGMINMRKRAEELGSVLVVTSTPGSGTTIAVTVKLHRQKII